MESGDYYVCMVVEFGDILVFKHYVDVYFLLL